MSVVALSKIIVPQRVCSPNPAADRYLPALTVPGWQSVATGALVIGSAMLGVTAHHRLEPGGTGWIAATVVLGVMFAALTAGTCARIAAPRKPGATYPPMSSTGIWFTAGVLFAAVSGSLSTQPVLLIAAATAVVAITTVVGHLNDHDRVSATTEGERVRQIFGRYVGEDVAQTAMSCGADLTGQEVEVGVLFVDLADSTRLASVLPPAELALLLNDFFRIIVDTVGRHGGFVNKFEGDAALAIFGAPRALADSAGAALRTARDLGAALTDQLPANRFGIGVSAGRVFAGQVGAPTRLEYTVIGDPVNEAARLTDLAKTEAGHVLASASAVSSASPTEGTRWDLGESAALRGRAAVTRLARPTVAEVA